MERERQTGQSLIVQARGAGLVRDVAVCRVADYTSGRLISPKEKEANRATETIFMRLISWFPRLLQIT